MGLKRLRDFRLRRPLGLAVASAGALGVLTILWLAVSTRTAILNAELNAIDARRQQLEWENTEMERNIGLLSSAQTMEQRMRVAGFGPPERAMYITVTVDLTVVPSGLAATATPTNSILFTAPLTASVTLTPAGAGGPP